MALKKNISTIWYQESAYFNGLRIREFADLRKAAIKGESSPFFFLVGYRDQ